MIDSVDDYVYITDHPDFPFNDCSPYPWWQLILPKLFGTKWCTIADGYLIEWYTWRGVIYVVNVEEC